jgi:uncharacterized protein with HEPN domain
MPHDDLVYVGHMFDAATKAAGKVAGIGRSEFERDETLRLALTYLLQIIGEAARRVSVDYQTGHPEIPWKAIIGMRHKVVHDYFGVDDDVVWDTVVNELPPLIEKLRSVLP